MNYLQLVRRLQVEAGASGVSIPTVIGLGGEAARLATWINAAWVDVQNENLDWDWMRSSFSFPTINAQASYTPIECGVTDFGSWKRDTFRSYNTAVGLDSEQYINHIDYDDWRNMYLFGNNRTVYSEPIEFAIRPQDNALCLGFIPNGQYTIVGDYFKVASELVNDADIPNLPVKYHMVIVYRALEMYGMYEAAQDAVMRGKTEYRKLSQKMYNDQMPEITLAGALV
jgi:hypothetical protein